MGWSGHLSDRIESLFSAFQKLFISVAASVTFYGCLIDTRKETTLRYWGKVTVKDTTLDWVRVKYNPFWKNKAKQIV